MTIRWKTLAWLSAAMLFAGLLAVWSGLFPLGATSGHWAVTQWLVSTTKRRTVKARSLGIEVPALDDRSRLRRSAGYYDNGCRPCHGSPGTRPPETMRFMLPRPPDLAGRIQNWETEELFWIVKHGLKFTGMPGWPSQSRDDEVWDMTAFLLALPGMEPAEYRDLAGRALVPGPEAPPVAATCARCHGPDGQGRGGAAPRIAGQRPGYLHCALEAYARGDRFSGIMETVASSLSKSDMRELAVYYGALPANARDESAARDPEVLSRGEEIALRGVPGEKVPSCADCHGPGSRPRRPSYPNLAGQYRSYLELQIALFQKAQRGGSPFAHLMKPVIRRLKKEEVESVVSYYASLAQESTPTFDGTTSPTGDACDVPGAESSSAAR